MTQTQIKVAFQYASSLEDAKKIFKELSKVCHPDKGGSTEAQQDLKAIYDHIVEHKIFFSNNSEFDIDIEKIVSNLLHIENINIEIVGSWIWITGETKDIRDILKNLGFKWASKKKAWHWAKKRSTARSSKSLEEIKATYGSKSVRGSSTQQTKISA